MKLLTEAKKVSAYSYSPYSHFKVGAALLSKDNQLFCGTNVENISFGATICAERSAITSCIAHGTIEISIIAIIGSGDVQITPCGICRQVLQEFNSELIVICSNYKQLELGIYQTYNLQELLPSAFNRF